MRSYAGMANGHFAMAMTVEEGVNEDAMRDGILTANEAGDDE